MLKIFMEEAEFKLSTEEEIGVQQVEVQWNEFYV